jgi:flagellar protein FlaG
MNIDSLRPVAIEAPSPAVAIRPLLSIKGHDPETPPHPAVRDPTSGNPGGLEATDEAMQDLVRVVEPFNVSLKFTRDSETGTIVVEMIDQKSGETLQQFPNAARLQIAATLTKLQGKIINVQA